ncbi:hypothetical protein GJ496_001717 [Pomphorhynchus laevis]|nr:hypothetical protein GJ496_001717 [Pomphorhynchus laevis]
MKSVIYRYIAQTRASTVLSAISQLDLRVKYNEEVNFRKSVELVTALALVPVDYIDECWNYIQTERGVHCEAGEKFSPTFSLIG